MNQVSLHVEHTYLLLGICYKILKLKPAITWQDKYMLLISQMSKITFKDVNVICSKVQSY